MHRICVAAVAAAALLLSAGAAASELPQRVAAGDVTAGGAVLWARASTAGNVMFEWTIDPAFASGITSATVAVADAARPAKRVVSGLTPGTRYYYRATDAAGASSRGEFTTADGPGAFRGFRMGVSGDWRGELSPYPAVKNAVDKRLDLWISLGDTIYADVPSPAVPIEQCITLDEYRAKHGEVYSDRFGVNPLAELRASTSLLVMIDDHEVTNDFAGGAPPASDPRFAGQPGAFINQTPQYIAAMTAVDEYNPIETIIYPAVGDARTDGRPDLYRARTWGRDAAVFQADARSFRDEELPAANPTDPASVGAFLFASFNPARTMLSHRQLDRLKADLAEAQAAGVVWKFVMAPEPIQNLGVLAASDRYEGYAYERAELLRFVDLAGIQNVVFVSADIHGTLINNLTYQNGPLQPQIPVRSFEITTGAVAYDAPFGPTVAGLAFALGIPGALPPAVYASLPAGTQEAYITGLIDAQLTPLGYDTVGLAGAPVRATLLEGGWTATNSFGWTEFEVDPDSQALTVTTYGIAPYTQAQLLADPAAIISRTPAVLSRFIVEPDRCPADLDGDGFATFADYLQFLNLYDGQDPRVDYTRDGQVDFSDYLEFLNRYDSGC